MIDNKNCQGLLTSFTIQFAINKLGNPSLLDKDLFLTKIIVKIYKEYKYKYFALERILSDPTPKKDNQEDRQKNAVSQPLSPIVHIVLPFKVAILRTGH